MVFSPEKIRQVFEFPEPNTKQKLKQFLGLANYFRDHIKNHSIHAAPLQKYLEKYTKRQAHHEIVLDAEARTAFNTIKEMIECCPKLFFLNETGPSFVYTDACTYGMGGYVTQLVTLDDGKCIEVPIGFMSQSFNASQLKWDIPQKEAYAIYATLKKFEYILQYRPFTLKTDHKNITFLNTSPLSTIRKWKVYIQEFNLTLSFVKG